MKQTIIGHGKVENAELVLELGDVTGSFILLLALPDGMVETYSGQLSFDDRWMVVDVGGQFVGIDELVDDAAEAGRPCPNEASPSRTCITTTRVGATLVAAPNANPNQK